MLTIYGIETNNTVKVLLTAEEVVCTYQFNLLDLLEGEHKTPEHIARHPLGKVPAIDDDGDYLYESNAICRYLAVKHDSPLYRGDALQLARIDQWVDLMTLHIGKWVSVFFFEEIVREKYLKQSPQQDAIDEAQNFLDQQLPIMDKQLQDNTFLLGEQLTIADTIAMSYIQIHEVTSVDLSNYGNIMRWYQNFKNRDSFRNTMAAIGSK